MKRLWKAVLAASLAFGLAAGGAVSPAGVPYAQAAVPAEAHQLLEKLQDLFVRHLDDAEQDAYEAAYENFVEGYRNDANFASYAAPLAGFLNAGLDAAERFTNEEVARLIYAAVYPFTLHHRNVEEMKGNLLNSVSDPDIRAAVNKLLAPSQHSLDTDAGIADIVEFLNAFRAALLDQVELSDAFLYLRYDEDDADELRTRLEEAIAGAVAEVLEQEELLLVEALQAYISADHPAEELAGAIVDTVFNLADAYDDQNLTAIRALMKGVVLAETLKVNEEVSNNGRELTLKLSILGITVPGVVWEVVSSQNNMITYSNGQFVLSSSAAANTAYNATVRASLEIDDIKVKLWEGEITMTYTPPAAPGPIYVPTPTPLPVVVPSEEIKERVEEVRDAVQEAAQQLQNVPAEERSSVIRKAIGQAQEALNQISRVDMSKVTVETDEGKATVNMTEAAVETIVKQIQTIAEQAAAVNEALRQLDPNAAVKPVLTLDLGTVDADVEVPLPLEVLEAAKEAGVNIGVTVNGVSVSFNPAVLNQEVTFTVSRLDRSVAVTGANQNIVSDVFDIAFLAGNNEIAEFDEPVTLELTVSGSASVNGDFLAVAKVEENGLTIYGGTVSGGVIRVKRTSFSAYTVVQNRVAFNDTDAVEGWAGRQIRSIAAKGIVQGRGDGVFDPDAHITRAEFAKMIAKAFGIDGGSAQETFVDVTDEDWFQPYVAALQKWGITNGRGGSATFAPHEKITRAEMATMIARALQRVDGVQSFADAEATLAKFSDAGAIHETLRAGVAFAADYGIVQGRPGGVFEPDSFATRAEAAVMIYRMLNID